MRAIPFITEKELLEKVEAGVHGTNTWKKPMLLLTKSDSDYNYISDVIREKYKSIYYIVNEPHHIEFERVDGKLKCSLNGVELGALHPDVELYGYLGGYISYDEPTHKFCVNCVEFEGKPVISYFCIENKGCAVEDIPDWFYDAFEIVMLQLPY